jgi:hypothetical protein
VVRTNEFTWTSSLNISTFNNEFKKLPFEEQIVGTKKLVVGRSIYDFWLRDWVGVDAETGEGLYRADVYDPADANIKIVGTDTLTTRFQNARFHFAGQSIPDFFGGWTNSFRYKGFTLSTLVSFSIGGDFYDGIYAGLMSADPDGGALHTDILSRWQKPGDITSVPKMDNIASNQTNVASDRWLTDGSWLNFRSINLSYNFSREMLQKMKLRGASVYLAGENLGWLSSRKGMFVSESFQGTSSNTFTPARTFTLGLNVNF